MGTLFKLSELESIVSQSIPRSYKTNKVVDGKVRTHIVIPSTPTIELLPSKDRIEFKTNIFRPRNSWYAGKVKSNGVLFQKIKTLTDNLMQDQYPDINYSLVQDVDKGGCLSVVFKSIIKVNTNTKLVSTDELQHHVTLITQLREALKHTSI